MDIWSDLKLTWLANYLKSFPATSFQAFSVSQWMHENAVEIPADLPAPLAEMFGEDKQKEKPAKIDPRQKPGESDNEWFMKLNKDLKSRHEEEFTEKLNNKKSSKNRALFLSFQPAERARLIGEVIDALEVRDPGYPVQKDLTVRNLEGLFSRLGFGDDELRAGLFAAGMANRDTITLFNGLIDKLALITETDPTLHIARFIDMPADRTQSVLAADAPLRKAVFISRDDRNVMAYAMDPAILAVLREPHPDPDAMIDQLIGPFLKTEHDFDDDFDFLGAEGQAILQIASGMLQQGIVPGRGSICLYGGGGAGKTTLVAAIGKKLGYAVHDVGQCLPEQFAAKKGNQYGPRAQESGRQEQLNAFLLSSFLVGHLKRKAILHVGEAEGMFRDPNDHRFSGGGSKSHLQAALDVNGALTFMTTNRIDLMAESTLRRMIPLFHIPPMPWTKRAQVITDNARKTNLTLSFENSAILARDFPMLTPGMLEYVVKAVGGRPDLKNQPASAHIDALRLVFGETARGLQGGTPFIENHIHKEISFETKLMNASANLEEFAAELTAAGPGRPRYSLCIIGPQGTGKRSCAQWLCDRALLPAMRVGFDGLLNRTGRSFDLALLVSAMERAAMDGSALIIEDARLLFEDEFQFGRDAADLFDSPKCPVFVLADQVFDAPWAKLSRFTFALRTDYLSDRQKNLAFKTFFGTEPPAGFADGARLTPADFMKVRRQCNVMGLDETRRADRAVSLLRGLHNAASPRQRAGFHDFG